MTNLPKRVFLTSPYAVLDQEGFIPDLDGHYPTYAGQRPKFSQVDPQGDEISVEDGIPAVYTRRTLLSEPLVMTRHMMNEIGFLSSQGAFKNQFGIKPTFSKALSDKYNGYPKGAILRYGRYEVVSLQDDNRVNFVEPDEHNPNPYEKYEIGTRDTNGVMWWAYVQRSRSFTLLPNLKTGKVVWSKKIGLSDPLTFRVEFIGNEHCWLALCFSPTSAKPHIGRKGFSVISSSVRIGPEYVNLATRKDEIASEDITVPPSVRGYIEKCGLIPVMGGGDYRFEVAVEEEGLFEIYRFEA